MTHVKTWPWGLLLDFCCGRDVSVQPYALSVEFQVTACSLQHQMPEILKTLAKVWDYCTGVTVKLGINPKTALLP